MPVQRFHLNLLENCYAVAQLPAVAPVPEWATAGDFSSIVRTPDELSVVCHESLVPQGVRAERGWRCFRIAGQFDFTAVGVLASLTQPLAAAGISIFAISTFDTDYLLVKHADLDRALAALRQAGHAICTPACEGANRSV